MEKTKKVAINEIGKEVDNFEFKISEIEGFYFASYIEKKDTLNPLLKGGRGIIFKIMKKNCKLIDYKMLQ